MTRLHGTASALPRQANLSTPLPAAQDNDVCLVLALLRRAIDDSGWKHAAVASVLGVKPPYLSLMLSGEKPWTAKHLAALPDDVESLFAQRYAEQFGFIVVVPVDGEQAFKNFVSGLFGVLGNGLPARAARMAKCAGKPEGER